MTETTGSQYFVLPLYIDVCVIYGLIYNLKSDTFAVVLNSSPDKWEIHGGEEMAKYVWGF